MPFFYVVDIHIVVAKPAVGAVRFRYSYCP